MEEREVRCLNVDLHMRAVEGEDEKSMIIEGYPIIFNSPATHGFTEVIDIRALDNTDMTDVVLRYNHNDSFIVLARTRNNSLKLKQDEIGLKMVATLNPNIEEHRSVYEAIKSKLIDKMSFCFTKRAENYDYDTNTYTITDIEKLYDVSVVDQPFYDSTSLYARSLKKTEDRVKELREAEEEKREEFNTAIEELKKLLG